MPKVRCLNPKHTDSEPSMEVYENSAYCFSCGYSTNQVSDDTPKKPKENLDESFRYINSLPTRDLRGLQLPSDLDGYYIVWPGMVFYKKRLFKGPTRYVGPTGHRAPVFKIPGKDRTTVVVVEGELNALSLSKAIGDIYTIVTSGSATELSRCITETLLYTTVYVIVDKDVAGVIAGLKLKEQLLKHGKRTHLVAKETDYNQTLQDKGVDGLKEEAYRDLGLS